MAQNTTVSPDPVRHTRADFTALRAALNGLPITQIATLYYTEDDLEALSCTTLAALQARLEALRDHLIARASLANPHLAEGLRHARSSARWSKVAMQYLFEAAEFGNAAPQPADPVSAWLKPRVARHLAAEGLTTLGALCAAIETRGPTWWRPIPRLGQGKAAALLRWLQGHAATLGPLTVEGTTLKTKRSRTPITLDPNCPILVPLEALHLPQELDGRNGLNRAAHFSLIQARHDLEALESYLVKFRAQPKTHRAYQRELERLLLWAIYERRTALSSLLVEDCEAYKAFLAAPDARWCGPKTARWSVRWKPFEGPLSPSSQRYALLVIRAFFAWLVQVRYLGGNPWVAVGNPVQDQPVLPMKIEQALPESLWVSLSMPDGLLDQSIRQASPPAQVALRLAKAALLLIGNTGLRREEAARAHRSHLQPVPGHPGGLWELQVLGKRRKWRTVFLPETVVRALRDHWADREEDFDAGDGCLLSPLVVPPTPQAARKHAAADTDGGAGFSADGLYRMLTRALRTVATNPTLPMTEPERTLLASRGVHAFRHTFGTLAAARGLPLDVLQRVLGHTSLQTTTIYVQAERKRSIEEMGKLFDGR